MRNSSPVRYGGSVEVHDATKNSIGIRVLSSTTRSLFPGANTRTARRPARASQTLWKEYEQTLQEARARRERDWARYRDTAATERRRLRSKYRQQRHFLAALPICAADRDARAMRLVKSRQRESDRPSEEREL